MGGVYVTNIDKEQWHAVNFHPFKLYMKPWNILFQRPTGHAISTEQGIHLIVFCLIGETIHHANTRIKADERRNDHRQEGIA